MTCRIRDPLAQIYLTSSSCIACPLSAAIAFMKTLDRKYGNDSFLYSRIYPTTYYASLDPSIQLIRECTVLPKWPVQHAQEKTEQRT